MRRATVFLCLGTVFLLSACSRPALKGTVIQPPQQAPDFTLTDQHGAAFRLGDTRGKVVLISFIYTHCTDICPFITLKMKETIPLLGKDADRVVFVAVTTDPARDTQPVIDAYSRAAGMEDSWHFLTGPKDDVQKVWQGYGVGVSVTPSGQVETDSTQAAAQPAPAQPAAAAGSPPAPTQGLTGADLTTAGQLIDAFGGGYEVPHSAPFWFIDARGRIRAIMESDAAPADLAGDITALLHGA